MVLHATRSAGVAQALSDWWTGVFLVELLPLVILPVVAWHRLVRRRSWQHIVMTGPLAPERLLGLTLTLLVARAAMVSAVAWKVSIPAVHPFAYDAALSTLDRRLHGADPWRLLQALTAPPSLRVLDAFYGAWYAAFFLVVMCWGWAPPGERRARFVFALPLTWIAGSVISVMISSAGPVYFGRVTGLADPYAALAARLASAPLAATALQADLWHAYLNPVTGIVKGIAAFPSLHVALPALYAVSTPRRLSWLRWCWWAFTVITLVGSIVLGWHYAVDGYAGVIIACSCWWATGMVSRAAARRASSPPEQREQVRVVVSPG
jgi:hypothetical protein